MIFGKMRKPEKLDEFTIPILLKKTERSLVSMTSSSWEVYTEAKTDGFYYEKDGVKYYRVKNGDAKVEYYRQDDVVFLKDGRCA